MKSGRASAEHDRKHDLSRRDFLRIGAGFSAALACASALGVLGGCGEVAKSPAKNFGFLRESDLELFGALAPVVVLDLAQLAAARRSERLGDVLHKLDATCSALDLGKQHELRKLLDLLAFAPLRYLLAGVGAWNEASTETLQEFLTRWRGSRFATLNAGGNVLVKLVSTSYYALPATWQASGYPGPLERLYKAVNS
ncbi:MAG: hypothetical protein HY017_13470 [Betaproteobacteria bacterium]|nr:hypothetical protein [Betaproteobacteria bacterium]